MKPWCGCLPLGPDQRNALPQVLPAAAHSTEEVYAVGVGTLADPHPCWPGRPPCGLPDGVSERDHSLSATLQSHAFQKMVGARIEGSMPSTRSLIAVTLGNWKMVTP